MPLILSWKGTTKLPVEADALRPDTLATQSADAVARLMLPVGNEKTEVGELFRVSGTLSAGLVIVEADAPNVNGLGRGLTAGQMYVRGHVGHRLGEGLNGGLIDVAGNVGDWAGAAMISGTLRINGSAGDYLGAALPGSRMGMREGVILVHGSAGSNVGLAQRRGMIAVRGSVGDDLGHDVIAGSIFVFGTVGERVGAGLKRGTIALFGTTEPDLLPTFRFACRYRPPFLTIYLRQLVEWGLPVPPAAFEGAVSRYNGDLLTGGRGEILFWGEGSSPQ